MGPKIYKQMQEVFDQLLKNEYWPFQHKLIIERLCSCLNDWEDFFFLKKPAKK